PRSGSATIPLRARADRLAVAGVRLFDDSFIDFLIRTGAEFAEAEGPYAVRDNLPAYHQSESARSFAGDRRADRVGSGRRRVQFRGKGLRTWYGHHRNRSR